MTDEHKTQLLIAVVAGLVVALVAGVVFFGLEDWRESDRDEKRVEAKQKAAEPNLVCERVGHDYGDPKLLLKNTSTRPVTVHKYRYRFIRGPVELSGSFPGELKVEVPVTAKDIIDGKWIERFLEAYIIDEGKSDHITFHLVNSELAGLVYVIEVVVIYGDTRNLKESAPVKVWARLEAE